MLRSLSPVRRPPRSVTALAFTLVCAPWLGACGGDQPQPVKDTPVVVTPAEPIVPEAPAPPSMNGWDVDAAGRVLLVPAASAQRAQLIFPQFTDSTLMPSTSFAMGMTEGMQVDLFSQHGLVGTATLTAPAPGEPPTRRADSTGVSTCTAWPTAQLIPATEPLAVWTAAFAAGHAAAIPLDSIYALPSADSAWLAAEVARVASGLPQDTASALRGLPFVVRNVRLFAPDSGVEAFVAIVTRRVNQEASQEAEQLLLIGERVAGGRMPSYMSVYTERVAGLEETLELSEVLAAVRLGRRPTLVVGRDYGDGTAYALLERSSRGRWSVRWSSAYTGC